MNATRAMVIALLAATAAACSSSSPGDGAGGGPGTTTGLGGSGETGGSAAGEGGAPGATSSGGSGGPAGAPGATASGGASGGGVAGDSGRGGAAGGGGRTGSGRSGQAGGGGAIGGKAGGPPAATGGAGGIAPPVSDSTSTLGISAPGSGYHVEGNIPYGPHAVQRLDVMYPTNAGPHGTVTLPGVIMFHGGGWIDNKPAALKASMSSFFSRFLKHGFLVCNVEYRLADGTANGATAPAADQDALLAAKWFWDHLDYYHVDKTKYVVTGASAGGQLALMVGMATGVPDLGPTNPTDFQIAAIVNGYGPSDVNDLLTPKDLVGRPVAARQHPEPRRAGHRAEPHHLRSQEHAAPHHGPGRERHDGPNRQSQALYDALVAVSADTALHFVPGAGHGFSTPAAAWPDAENAMFTFLVQHGLGK